MPESIKEQPYEVSLHLLGVSPDQKIRPTKPAERIVQDQSFWWRLSGNQIQSVRGKAYARGDIEC
jgi:hypothetical protein